MVHGNTTQLGNLYSGNVSSEASATQVDVAGGKASVLNFAYASVTGSLTAPVQTITGAAKVGPR